MFYSLQIISRISRISRMSRISRISRMSRLETLNRYNPYHDINHNYNTFSNRHIGIKDNEITKGYKS